MAFWPMASDSAPSSAQPQAPEAAALLGLRLPEALALWGDRPAPKLVPLFWQARAPKGQEAPPLPAGPEVEPDAWRLIRVDPEGPQWLLGRPPALPEATA